MPAPVNHLEERLQDSSELLTDILPAAITLAMMLRHRSMATWLRTELDGYTEDAALPACRQNIPGHIVAKSPQYGWIPAPVNDKQTQEYARVSVTEGIRDIEAFCLSCKKGSGKQVALAPEPMKELQKHINLTAQLAITVNRETYSGVVRITRGALYFWATSLIELGMGGERNSFKDADKSLAATLDNPERFLEMAVENAQQLPVPGVRESGFFERMFSRAG